MVSKKALLVSCHGLVWVAALVLAFWAGGARAAARYDTATPYTPPYNKFKYIPLHPNDNGYETKQVTPQIEDTEEGSTGVAPSEFILSAMRTVLEVLRNVNKQRSMNKSVPAINNTTTVTIKRKKSSNSTSVGTGRGFEDYYDDEHHYHETTTTAKPMKQGRYTDPWAGYYDWIINEGSFKFWSVFQLFTAALLLYACLSAIYYAKFNPILPDYSMEYDDYFLERTVGRKARSLDASETPSGLTWINPRTFQFILDSLSKHYEEE